MKKMLLILFSVLTIFTLSSCIDSLSVTTHTKHTFEYIPYEESHFKQFTCGCPSPEITEMHYDHDNDYICDACGYELEKPEEKTVLGTYYLPYRNVSFPLTITFTENERCKFTFKGDDYVSGLVYYEVEGDYVSIYFGTSKDYCTFLITDYGIIFDKDLSSEYWWGSHGYGNEGIAYFKDEKPNIDIVVSTAYQAVYDLEEMPEVVIFDNYELASGRAYAVKFATPNTESWCDVIYGTKATFTYSSGSEILIYYCGYFYDLHIALARKMISAEDVEFLNQDYHDCKIAHSYDEGVVVKCSEVVLGQTHEILYTCYICGETKTTGIPCDFSFTLRFGFNGYYNSETGYLEDGYNFDLDTKCETTLILDEMELMNIYRLFINGNIENYHDGIQASEDLMEPSYTIFISYKINGEEHKFGIYGASFMSFAAWEEGMEFGYNYYKVLNEYIYSSEEYKSLPPNQMFYE